MARGARQPLPPSRFEIVGVARDVRNAPLGQAVEPAVYFSTRQFPFRELCLTVRANDTATAVAAIRNALKDVAPSVPMARTQTWGERLAGRTAQSRLLMTILVFFGLLAALLAAIGVYGLFSWSVALRTRELAIRLTLGARSLSVGSLVVRQSTVLVVVGMVIGLTLIRLAQGALTRVLYGVTPGDLGSTAVAPALLRAMRVDPVEGLRAD